MADTQVLGTCVFGREGSSPFSRTKQSEIFFCHFTTVASVGKDVAAKINRG